MANNKPLAPIAMFVFNRLKHLRASIESLQNNDLAQDSDLFIFSDGARTDFEAENVAQVRKFLATIRGFSNVTLINRERNLGLANNIIDGVSKIVKEYGKIIVLEDDLVLSPVFCRFINEALFMYESDPKVASVHGYVYPIDGLPETFFIRGADCWGWGTWKRAWDVFEKNGNRLLETLTKKNLQYEADFNGSFGYTQMLQDQIGGKNNSWAIRWYMSAFLNEMLTLYPGKSYVKNIGFDSEGTHCRKNGELFSAGLNSNCEFFKIRTIENQEARKKFEAFFRALRPSLIRRCFLFVERLIRAIATKKK